jgi:hypothetical protein
LQRVEGGAAADLDDDLAIDDEILCTQAAQHGRQLRKIAAERLAGFRPQFDRLAAFEGKASKSIPFWLVLPGVFLLRQRVGGMRFHRRCAGRQRKPLRRSRYHRSSVS